MPMDPSKQARDAAEAIRRLNHVTLAPKQPIPAPVISTTVQHLEQLLARLPQALHQLSQQLHAAQAAEQIRMDDGTDPATAATETRADLDDTIQALHTATRSLDHATSLLFHMGAPLQ
jgi:hypothetical protein